MNTASTTSRQIFVCTNKFCQEKGSECTMATFSFLTYDQPDITVSGVNCLGRCNRGPNTRMLTSNGSFVEAAGVASVDRIVELLETHLELEINRTTSVVLKLNYEGNMLLKIGEVDTAIKCYDKAMEMRDKEQEGVLLVMRGTALLQRTYACRMRHKDVLRVAEEVLPSYETITNFLNSMASLSPALRSKVMLMHLLKVNNLYAGINSTSTWNEVKTRWPEIRRGSTISSGDDLLNLSKFTWALYENSLMRALQDLLTATLVLPKFSQAWRRAGDALTELRRFSSAVEYYEAAMRLDDGLEELLVPTIERLKVLEKLLENAEMKGWPVEAILSLVDE
eukprot:CAMPEP_0173193130 /NCGR_PEP_ID=MMETSP1141-20130122/13794_1 /TAXON_ID=483371 /ORGANISM="non described non described, Strain CCMP2298" /LENGTH=336 /DNA_ID=CAMNT_0014117445 /DNA_START=151 /DNA_END=1161 /DNA_ORIENTATION=-